MPLIFRIVKGEPLTFLEGDNNLRYLEGLTISSSAAFSNWTGSASSQFAGTASLALTASYALNAGTTIDTGSLISTASFNAFTASYNTGSFTGTFTGDLIGTASYVNLFAGPGIIINGLEITSSVRTVNGIFPTNGNIPIALSATVTGTSASLVSSGSGNITGSILDGLVWIISNDPTPANNGDVYIYSSGSVGAWYQVAPLDQAASDARYIKLDGANTPMTGDLNMGGNNINNAGNINGTASYATSASFAISASWAPPTIIDTGSLLLTSSFNTFTSSYFQDSSSFDQRINSISFDSSSLVTTASFNAFTSSYNTGSFSGSFTGSFEGTASWANNATTASYVLNAISASFASTASFVQIAQTASYVLNAVTASHLIGYPQDSASFDQRINNISFDTSSLPTPAIIVNVATTAALPGTALYNNGVSGVGAFISSSANVSLGAIDGITMLPGDRLLVKNQAAQLQNGVYDVISTGSAAARYILSRSIDSDETAELDAQIVIPSFGSTNAGGIFAQNTNNPIVGTNNIVYARQTSTLVTQNTAGTQAIYQIPWWTGGARDLSRGSTHFRYINVTSGTTVTTSSLQLTGSFNLSGSAFVRGLTTASQTDILTYNSSTGQVFFTASSAIGGGGSGLSGGTQFRVPVWTGATTLGTSSLYESGSVLKSVYGGNDIGLKLEFASNEYKLGDPINGWGVYTKLDNGGIYAYTGDYSGVNNGTSIIIEDPNQIIKTSNQGNDIGLILDFANNVYTLGDNSSGLYINTPSTFALGNFAENNNGTLLSVDDASENIRTIHGGQDIGINLDFQTGIYKLGDHSNISGSTKLVIDDNARTVTVSGSTILSGSLFVNNLTSASQANVLTYNSSTGQVFFTASSAIGGGGGPTPTLQQVLIAGNTGSLPILLTDPDTTISKLELGHDDGTNNPYIKFQGGGTIYTTTLRYEYGNSNFDRVILLPELVNPSYYLLATVNNLSGSFGNVNTWQTYETASSLPLIGNPGILYHVGPPGQQELYLWDYDGGVYYKAASIDTGSFLTTGSLSTTQQLSGSLNITGSLNFFSGSTNASKIENGWVVLSQVSMSLDFANDAAAAAGGVPLGGLYRNGNAISIRIA